MMRCRGKIYHKKEKCITRFGISFCPCWQILPKVGWWHRNTQPTTLSGKHKNRNKHDSHNLKCVRILQLSQQTMPFSLIDMDWSKEIKGIPDRWLLNYHWGRQFCIIYFVDYIKIRGMLSTFVTNYMDERRSQAYHHLFLGFCMSRYHNESTGNLAFSRLHLQSS